MDITDTGRIREFRKEDAAQLLELMRGLAEFEGYIDDFCVTEPDLIANGLGDDRTFTAFVAPGDDQAQLHGMAVTYVIPWTYDLRPVLVLKELFVRPGARKNQIGRSLFKRVAALADSIGASKVQWTVLRSNVAAKTFYRAHGGRSDEIWENWLLPLRE